ncbi:MAG: hypothetical protein NWE99_11000 [Candidatus Bathyarchaeota archaeon]|nr:hypothetical protein [Candidatus Bathyarchaeota archaeon]
MPRGKPWTVDEEKQLRDLINAGYDANEIANVMGKDAHAVYEKAKRLGLKVIMRKKQRVITSALELPADLPSVEEQLKVLAAAVKALQTAGLDKTEVMRLANIIRGVEVYIARFAEYVDYRGLERELADWKAKYAALAKKVQGA